MLAILSAYALLASLRLFKRTSSTLLINPFSLIIVRVLHKIGLVRIFLTNKRHFQRKITNAMENLGKPVVGKRGTEGIPNSVSPPNSRFKFALWLLAVVCFKNIYPK